jgi:hypothetical protein
MATESPIQIAPPSTGPFMDAFSVVNGNGQTVNRQATIIADPSDFAALQSVREGSSLPAATDGAAVFVRRPDSEGSGGSDFSANPQTWPLIGSGFPSGSTLFPSWVLLATVPANQSRFKVTVDNMSQMPILCLRDDGTASTGAQPSNPTGFTLNPKVSAGPEGGHFESTTFRGRLQIFGVSSTQFVAISTD